MVALLIFVKIPLDTGNHCQPYNQTICSALILAVTSRAEHQLPNFMRRIAVDDNDVVTHSYNLPIRHSK